MARIKRANQDVWEAQAEGRPKMHGSYWRRRRAVTGGQLSRWGSTFPGSAAPGGGSPRRGRRPRRGR